MRDKPKLIMLDMKKLARTMPLKPDPDLMDIHWYLFDSVEAAQGAKDRFPASLIASMKDERGNPGVGMVVIAAEKKYPHAMQEKFDITEVENIEAAQRLLARNASGLVTADSGRHGR